MQATDSGTIIEITVMDGVQPIPAAVDISTATTKEFIISKIGQNTSVSVPADFVDAGVDGKLKYTTTASTFLTPGTYEIQVHLIDPAPYDRLTSKGVIKIGKNV